MRAEEKSESQYEDFKELRSQAFGLVHRELEWCVVCVCEKEREGEGVAVALL